MRWRLLVGIAVLCWWEPPLLTAAGDQIVRTPGLPRTLNALAPVLVENRGQFEAPVRYRTTWPSPMATVTDEGLVLTQVGPDARGVDGSVSGHNVRLRFEATETSRTGQLHTVEPAPTRCSYFLGNDAARWITDVVCWSEVAFDQVAPGVSVAIHGRHGVIGYDVLVAPGASSDDVQIVVEGVEKLLPRSDGSIDFVTPLGVIHQSTPVSWEVDETGEHRVLESHVRVLGANRLAFEVVDHDPRQPLVIDPGLGYGTFVEGSLQDVGYAVAVDAAGSAHVAGTSASADFPVTPGAFQLVKTPNDLSAQDAVIAKLSPDGSYLEYATFLGGHGEDYPNAIALDEEGNAYVGGWVAAPDFPTTPGAFSQVMKGSGDAFLTKLDSKGTSLIYSTFFGGSAPEATKSETCNDLAVDTLGRVVIGGFTGSADLPVTPNAVQRSIPNNKGGYVARISADGSTVEYCSYIGCSDLTGVAVDASMNLYAAGRVSSSPQGCPLTPGAFQTVFGGHGESFALKINPDGSLAWCTLLSGNDDDRVTGLEVDAEGRAVVAGFTSSFNFPTTPGAFDPTGNGFSEGYVVKLADDGASLVWGTYLGGSDDDDSKDLAIDPVGNCYVVTHTRSSNFPVSADAFDKTLSVPGEFDVHVEKLSADGSTLLYGSYLGGATNGIDIPNGIAVDQQGNPYVTGYTGSPDFPTTPGALDPNLTGALGLFVTKFQISPWQVLGPGIAGAEGVTPYLTAIGSLLPGSTTSLIVGDTVPGASAWLVVGLQQLLAPLKGGTLFPAPLAVLTLAMSPAGGFELTFPWPASVPPGTEIDLQLWAADAAAPEGFSATNGLTAITP